MGSMWVIPVAAAATCHADDLTLVVIQMLCSAFLGILFLQSGLDKVFDVKGNLEYLGAHFAKSPLADQVPRLLATITVLEVSAGAASALGVVGLAMGRPGLAWIGALLANVSILSLFFGQRMAKDYAGAAGLVPYFVVTILSLWFLRS